MDKIYCRGLLNECKEEEGREIRGLAIVFNKWSNDLGGFKERILPNSISQELIDSSDIIANMEHNSQDYLLARSRNGQGTLKLQLQEDGLHFSFTAPETEKGEELLYNIRNGNLFECSFAFTVPSDGTGERWFKEDGLMRREIKKIDGLYDVSIVSRAAYSDTYCYNRSIPKEIKDLSEKIDKKMDYYKSEIEKL